MNGISDHFFEDSPVSRSAIGNVMYMCVLLSYSYQFLKNNTNHQVPKRNTGPVDNTAAADFQKLMINLPDTKREECFEKFQPVLENLCNSTGIYEIGECQHYVNNGIWDVCQSLIDFKQCDVITYEYSTEDYFRHPAFWGSCGFLIGCVLALIVCFIISCICSIVKKKKALKNGRNGTGSGTVSVETGKASKGTSSDTKNSSDDKQQKIGATVKPSVPKSQYIGEQFPTADNKKSVFFGAKTTMKPPAKSIKKPVDQQMGKNKNKKTKQGKDVGALTAMEMSLYK